MIDRQIPSQISRAIELYKNGDQQASRDCLKNFIMEQPANVDALLWLARITPDTVEAIAAARLALKLDPKNEVARRAVIAVEKRKQDKPFFTGDNVDFHTGISIATGMTLAQARSVKWPFHGINLPIGELLDGNRITLRDLGWAVEKAWHERLRDAARTVLLMELLNAETTASAKPLRVVVGNRYTERQERKNIFFSGLIGGIVFTILVELCIVDIVWMWMEFRLNYTVPPWLVLALFASVAITLGIGKWTIRFLEKANLFRQGRWGEEKIVDELRYQLDDRWTLFRNFEWPQGKGGDVDLILVGPGGVWAFEVKDYSGIIRNCGDRWEYRKKRRWEKMDQHPGKQARQNAVRVKEYFGKHGIDVRWVEAVVAWAGDIDRLVLDDPVTPVWGLDTLGDHIVDLEQKQLLPEKAVSEVVCILDRAVKKQQKAIENARK